MTGPISLSDNQPPVANLATLTPGINTSEFKAVMLFAVQTFLMPILVRHGIASEDVSNISEITFGAGAAVYALGRSVAKIVHSWKH